jgi:hypothetical protein
MIGLTQSIGDARFAQIVRGHFETDAVADGQADEMPAHFAGNMGEDFVLVIQHYSKHCARQNRLNRPFQFNWLFSAHTILHCKPGLSPLTGVPKTHLQIRSPGIWQ